MECGGAENGSPRHGLGGPGPAVHEAHVRSPSFASQSLKAVCLPSPGAFADAASATRNPSFCAVSCHFDFISAVEAHRMCVANSVLHAQDHFQWWGRAWGGVAVFTVEMPVSARHIPSVQFPREDMY